MNLFAKLRWYWRLARVYPTKEAYSDACARRIVEAHNSYTIGYRDGYKRGASEACIVASFTPLDQLAEAYAALIANVPRDKVS